MPQADLRTEAVGAFTKEHFLRYIAFERIASGIDTGERLLLWEKAEQGLLEEQSRSRKFVGHPLEQLLALPAAEILDVVQDHFRLLVALRGGVAEHHLGDLLRATRGVTDVQALDQDGQADFRVTFEKREVLIECKNTLRTKTAQGFPKVDFQKTRASQDDPCSRYYSPDQFEILAACLHPVTEKWEYTFCRTRDLSAHARCNARLASNVVVQGQQWSQDPLVVLRSYD